MAMNECNVLSAKRRFVAALASLCVLVSAQPALAGEAESAQSRQEGGYSLDRELEGMEIVHRFPESVPYGEGELLVFAIQYGLIYAGDATLEIRNIAEFDRRAGRRRVPNGSASSVRPATLNPLNQPSPGCG